MTIRQAALVLLLLSLGCGCVAPAASAPRAQDETNPTIGSRLSASPTRRDRHTPIAAARAFLELRGARFDMSYDRVKPGQPAEREWDATGVVEPARDRGAMHWRPFVPPAASPGPSADAQPVDDVDLLWDDTDWWGGPPPTSGVERRWSHTTRTHAREAAIIGRVTEEPLGLVRLAAESDPTVVTSLGPATHNGVVVDRWRIAIPLDEVRAVYVPPDTYLSLAQTFNVTAFPLEIWTANGSIRRVGYVLEREKAPYGGPDRLETWYEWSGFDEPVELVIPPAGEVLELPA